MENRHSKEPCEESHNNIINRRVTKKRTGPPHQSLPRKQPISGKCRKTHHRRRGSKRSRIRKHQSRWGTTKSISCHQHRRRGETNRSIDSSIWRRTGRQNAAKTEKIDRSSFKEDFYRSNRLYAIKTRDTFPGQGQNKACASAQCLLSHRLRKQEMSIMLHRTNKMPDLETNLTT